MQRPKPSLKMQRNPSKQLSAMQDLKKENISEAKRKLRRTMRRRES
jgi:hypothetical protein